ncbi:P-loop containing nucleoside triphosphate hydrolase protein [Coniophora puteana RWD-64-598 SS2]|uniref:DNA 3'-5' helicase n=1 Tax=Coniophora puteana (strain RWD-64-598) TaxID=741705 RepID=A0A5M3MX52_CONPW|nr:P-loop containing nucleoside triphosphate hydrolase protein [Coniophora puteana RWD-64-598 SS2]EIW83201.1 P-loop containing nucleoside triphosphate hydrolase protein [Coniophora puteana RWD-64-598 SS2]
MHVLFHIQGPLSETARESLDYLSFDFVDNLTLSDALVVHQAISWFDFYTKGQGQLREFQLRSTLKTLSGENVIVRAGTGYGKTMTMILPLLLSPQPSKIALTISPMKLLQQNHVEEFNRMGIPSIQINEDTPDDKELWKRIERGYYKNIFIAPEQLFRLKNGHIPRLASLMFTNRAFLESIGFFFIDEAHFIVLSGFPQRGEKDAFRPVYSRLGEILPLLRENPPVVILSATLPPPILHTVLETLHLDLSTTTQLMESVNRPNHAYAVHQLYSGIKCLKNYDFLVPTAPNAERPPKTVVFIDSRLSAARIASYLRWRISDTLKSSKVVSHLHSSMSRDYIDRVFSEFKTSSEISVLVSTSIASNGIDVSDIARVVCIGALSSLELMQQEFGRGGRNPTIETICLAVVEPWALTTEDSKPQSNKEKRTDPSVREYMSLKTCRRDYLRKKNVDDSQKALKFTGSYCCDNHNDGFSLTSFFPGAFLYSDPPKPKKLSRPTRDNRPQAQREPLRELIWAWRDKTRHTSTLTLMFPTNYLLQKREVDKLVKTNPKSLSSLANLVTFLGETPGWARVFGPGLFKVIEEYDIRVQAEIQEKKLAKKTAPRKQKKLKQEELDTGDIPPPPPTAFMQHVSEFQIKDEPWASDPDASQAFSQLPGLSNTSSQDAFTSSYSQITFEEPLVGRMHVPTSTMRQPKRSEPPSQPSQPLKRARKRQE